MLYEYQTSKKRDQKRTARLSRAGCVRRVPHPAHPAASHPARWAPPGIGKTQIMEQIAEETGVGLVSYTHDPPHAPVRARPALHREPCSSAARMRTVTAYTMSEIIASVYREHGAIPGTKEGILFLDEINCISETLTPMMLQFLQCKTFGDQRLPGRLDRRWRPATRPNTTNPCASSTWSRSTASSASTSSDDFGGLEGIRLPARHPWRDPLLS